MRMTGESPLKQIYWSLVLVFFLFSMAVTVAGYLLFEGHKKSLKQEKWDQLGAIADLKVSQMVNWRKERVEDGAIIFESPFIAPRIEQWFKDSRTVGVKEEILRWMASLQSPRQVQSFEAAVLLDAEGKVRLSVPEGDRILDPFSKTLVLQTAREKRVILSDLYRDETSGFIRLSLLVPILAQRGGGAVPVAVILLRIDPQRFLYPLIQSWPTPSPTSETLFVRREGDDVVFLNELRRRKNTALTLRFPMSTQGFPAAMAARGQEGVAEGFDYRGVPVLVAMRRIPDSPWFLVAKVDQEEIYAQIRTEARLVAVLVGVFVIGAAFSVGFLWRGQYLKAQRRSEEALRAREMELERVNKELEAFSYSASHDLRTPLLAMNGLSRIVLEKYSRDLDEKGQHFLHLIQEETKKMLQLIDDLMAFSKFKRQEMNLSIIDMGELAKTIFDELRSLTSYEGLEVDIKPLPKSPGDQAMIRQVLYNLISNAIKFTRPKGAGIIEIGCLAGISDHTYYVKDNGVGFDMNRAARLFEVFQRLHSADEFEGTGVGLAIVQRIIHRHGGRVWADGKLNEGAIFYFSLPSGKELERDGTFSASSR
jgi:signal transduction histidine kinase